MPALRGPLRRQNPAQGLPEKPQPGRSPHGDVSPTAVHPLGALCPVVAPGPTPASGGSSLWGLAPTHPHKPQSPRPSLLTLGLGFRGLWLLDHCPVTNHLGQWSGWYWRSCPAIPSTCFWGCLWGQPLCQGGGHVRQPPLEVIRGLLQRQGWVAGWRHQSPARPSSLSSCPVPLLLPDQT